MRALKEIEFLIWKSVVKSVFVVRFGLIKSSGGIDYKIFFFLSLFIFCLCGSLFSLGIDFFFLVWFYSISLAKLYFVTSKKEKKGKEKKATKKMIANAMIKILTCTGRL